MGRGGGDGDHFNPAEDITEHFSTATGRLQTTCSQALHPTFRWPLVGRDAQLFAAIPCGTRHDQPALTVNVMLLEAAVPRSEHDPDLETAAAAINLEAAAAARNLQAAAAAAINLEAVAMATNLEAAVAAANIKAVAANLAMHPVTGAFADSSHESAFAAQFFRRAFSGHVLLMALSHTLFIGMAIVAQGILRLVWIMITLFMTLGLVGRVLLHRMHDTARAQRLFCWIWTVLLMQACVVHSGSLVVAPALACPIALGGILLMTLPIALLHGSHGIGFVHKTVVIGLLLVPRLVVIAACGKPALASELSDMIVILVGSAVAHLVEVSLRHSYAEKVQEKLHLAEERRRHEERTEQLQAEKERLLYDMQRRPHDDSNRAAILRGLQAGSSQPHYSAEATAGRDDQSEAGGPAPSDSPPPSLPPGAPSSTSGASTAPPADGQLLAEAVVGVPGSCAAPSPDRLPTPEVMEAFLEDLLADEEGVVELQNILTPAEAAVIGRRPAQEGPNPGYLPLRPDPEVVASYPRPLAAAQRAAASVAAAPLVAAGVAVVAGVTVLQERAPFHVYPHGVREVVANRPQWPQWQGGSRPMTPRQQALYVALQRAQAARTEIEIYQLVHRLAVALGASRTESGTIKALHAVLIQMGRPGMSEWEAYSATGASMSNFKKWRRRVQHAQLDLPPP